LFTVAVSIWTMQKRAFSVSLSTAILAAFLIHSNMPPRTILEQVKQSGELQVMTRNAATTYYEGPQGPSGLEYDLTRQFAEYLGVKLEITVRDNLSDILNDVQEGKAHLAAAGLTVTEEREKHVRFGTPYQYITQQLVYNHNNNKPRNVAAITGGTIEVVANSSHVTELTKLKDRLPALEWHENKDADSSELLDLVAKNLVDYTIADSNEVTLNRRYHPEIRVAFDVTAQQPLAWAFAKGQDTSLYDEAQRFMAHMKKSGELDRLIKYHYTHASNYNYIGTNTYLAQVRRRLPRYQIMFEQAAMENKLDWRMLASVAYQESHWNPHAVSPTGVRGIMMLTRATAKQMSVSNRTDPKESIFGGAKYLRIMLDKVADEYNIKGQDQLWFALAAYNVGFGHLSDARMLTKLRGGNPDIWGDVKENLPLLRKRKWYRKTRHGYARGEEPVKYVETIRSYYDILNWYLDNGKPKYAERSILAFESSAL